tara:strand:- start:22958 stop:23263 length:306 start_codon:yes stop_codon:yes gene_type:complete
MNNQIIMWLLGIITAIALALSGWSLRAVTLLNETSVLTQFKLEQLLVEKDVDIEQNRRLGDLRKTDRKFWKLHQWSKTEINMSHARDGEPLAVWPDIEVEN